MKETSPLIITDNKSLLHRYQELKKGDIVLSRVSCRPAEEYIFLDLVERGVTLIPSALCQLVSRSKVFQTRILNSWMIPDTLAIHDIHQLMAAMNNPRYQADVITKLDKKNGGMGIHRWSSIEDVYNHASLGSLQFPFVVQPFIANSNDIRVIVLDDFVEAYWRRNPVNFRHNLHFGGTSTQCRLTDEQRHLCHQVMTRAKFPYAHIDLMVTEDNLTYIAEINLSGGMKGAKIGSKDYRQRIEAIHSSLLSASQVDRVNR